MCIESPNQCHELLSCRRQSMRGVVQFLMGLLPLLSLSSLRNGRPDPMTTLLWSFPHTHGSFRAPLTLLWPPQPITSVGLMQESGSQSCALFQWPWYHLYSSSNYSKQSHWVCVTLAKPQFFPCRRKIMLLPAL